MSRIGKRKIVTGEGIKIAQSGNELALSSDKGEIRLKIPSEIVVVVKGDEILCERQSDDKKSRALQGLYARLISTRARDLKEGFKKILEFKGSGYRAKIEGNELKLSMGYSHEVVINIPKNISVSLIKNSIVVEGYERDEVGDFAAKVRSVRQPEVYKGKGIRYKEEIIRRKSGKTAQTALTK